MCECSRVLDVQPLCTVSSWIGLMRTEVAGCNRIALHHYSIYIEFRVYMACLMGDDCNISVSFVGLKSLMIF